MKTWESIILFDLDFDHGCEPRLYLNQLMGTVKAYLVGSYSKEQGLSQNFKTGCPKLAIVKFWGIKLFKWDRNILRYQQ